MEISKRRKYGSGGSGFTLVELVIVIAIVIVLSVVSVPIYRSYVDKAKMAEGYALLGTVLSAQKNYYSEYGVFIDGLNDTNFTSYDPRLGIDIRGNKYFTCFRFDVGLGYEQKNKFTTYAPKPTDLQGNGYNCLNLIYIITSGATVYEGNL